MPVPRIRGFLQSRIASPTFSVLPNSRIIFVVYTAVIDCGILFTTEKIIRQTEYKPNSLIPSDFNTRVFSIARHNIFAP